MTLKVVVVTLFPEMFRALADFGVTGRAAASGLLDLHLVNPRDFTDDPHRSVDDRPYGGGPGMVMRAEPLARSIEAAHSRLPEARVVYLSPQGARLDQDGVGRLLGCGSLVLLAGRYEGIDERLIESHVDEECSIGDYVLSGGELPAMVLIDAMTRLLPGALGHEDSAEQDSFMTGLLDHPHYTRPEDIAGRPVPAVLLSGDHEHIRQWRLKQALGRTWRRRPDLLERLEPDTERDRLLQEFIREQDGT